ncbi:hypothetical protein L915_11137, partial [Phytophthora nicotianae]
MSKLWCAHYAISPTLNEKMPGHRGGRQGCPEGAHFVPLTEFGRAKGGPGVEVADAETVSETSCLTTVEKLALRPFLLSGRVSNNKVEGAEVESLEQRLKKRRCLEAREAGYRLVGSIPATSNK